MKFLNEIKAANNGILDVKKLGFEITNTNLPLEVGETKYDPDAETLITRITEADYLRHGQMEIVRVRNNTGSAIPKGSAVYVVGGIANSPILLIAPANNNEIIQARRMIGVTTTTIENNSFGKVITSGVIEGLNLPANEWTVGDCAYITTNGQYVNTPPSKGLITIRVGMVIRVDNDTGALLVFSRFNPLLGMLSDVDISEPTNGDVLSYDASLGIWRNSTIEVASSFFLKDLEDVSLTDPSTGQILVYDDDLEIWVNSNLEAEAVGYNTTYGGMQPNVQSAVDQLFYMFKFFTLELDGYTSGVSYDESLALNGGFSNSIFGNNFDSGTSQVLRLNSINGGVSADYNINLLNAGFSDTVYTDELNFGDSSVSSEDTINGGES